IQHFSSSIISNRFMFVIDLGLLVLELMRMLNIYFMLIFSVENQTFGPCISTYTKRILNKTYKDKSSYWVGWHENFTFLHVFQLSNSDPQNKNISLERITACFVKLVKFMKAYTLNIK
ncbi:hypothetical protein L9F63_004174, partial [Diploptera punctata]